MGTSPRWPLHVLYHARVTLSERVCRVCLYHDQKAFEAFKRKHPKRKWLWVYKVLREDGAFRDIARVSHV